MPTHLATLLRTALQPATATAADTLDDSCVSGSGVGSGSGSGMVALARAGIDDEAMCNEVADALVKAARKASGSA
jgi:hypothetical protein